MAKYIYNHQGQRVGKIVSDAGGNAVTYFTCDIAGNMVREALNKVASVLQSGRLTYTV